MDGCCQILVCMLQQMGHWARSDFVQVLYSQFTFRYLPERFRNECYTITRFLYSWYFYQTGFDMFLRSTSTFQVMTSKTSLRQFVKLICLGSIYMPNSRHYIWLKWKWMSETGWLPWCKPGHRWHIKTWTFPTCQSWVILAILILDYQAVYLTLRNNTIVLGCIRLFVSIITRRLRTLVAYHFSFTSSFQQGMGSTGIQVHLNQMSIAI